MGMVQRYAHLAQAVDGMSVLDVEAAARVAAEEVRTGGGPRFVELRTYRYRAHSMADPDLYRTKEEIERWKQRDPIALFEAHLREASLLTDADVATLERRASFGKLQVAAFVVIAMPITITAA